MPREMEVLTAVNTIKSSGVTYTLMSNGKVHTDNNKTSIWIDPISITALISEGVYTQKSNPMTPERLEKIGLPKNLYR